MMPVFRRGEAYDLDRIAEIQSRCSTAAHWNPADYLGHELWVAEADLKPTAFLVIRHLAPGECEILNLAVHPDFRRRSLATGLLQAAFEHFHGDVFLEVRESNTEALNFYQAIGFEQLSVRHSYYDNPQESAIVMKFHSC